MIKLLPPISSDKGVTLIEAMISVVLLAIVATGISTLYVSGHKSLDYQADRMLLDSHLRSRMEWLLSHSFDQLSAGSEVVTVNGKNYTIDWSVDLTDLDGDATPEPTAKLITVSADGRSLTTLVVDNEGRLGKI